MGRGAKEHPHFYFYDVDNKDFDPEIFSEIEEHGALIVRSRRGFHIISSKNLDNPYLLKVADPKCPGNAVRFYPHDDLELVRPARLLCIKVAKIYESIFNGQKVTEEYEPCDQPLKFGIYIAEKDGIKLTGPDRHPDMRTKEFREKQELEQIR